MPCAECVCAWCASMVIFSISFPYLWMVLLLGQNTQNKNINSTNFLKKKSIYRYMWIWFFRFVGGGLIHVIFICVYRYKYMRIGCIIKNSITQMLLQQQSIYMWNEWNTFKDTYTHQETHRIAKINRIALKQYYKRKCIK